MKKQLTAAITVTACVALYAAVWPQSAEVGNLPAEFIKNAISAEIAARSEEARQIILSDDTPAPEAEAIVESEPPIAEITAEKPSFNSKG